MRNSETKKVDITTISDVDNYCTEAKITMP